MFVCIRRLTNYYSQIDFVFSLTLTEYVLEFVSRKPKFHIEDIFHGKTVAKSINIPITNYRTILNKFSFKCQPQKLFNTFFANKKAFDKNSLQQK